MNDNQAVFDYIETLMNTARQGKVREKVVKVEFKPPTESEPNKRAIKALDELKSQLVTSSKHIETIRTWTYKYMKCRRCARGFIKWADECEIGPEDNLEIFMEEAKKLITYKRWI